jgi:hypothetical protein
MIYPIIHRIKYHFEQSPHSFDYSILLALISTLSLGLVLYTQVKIKIPLFLIYIMMALARSIAIIPGLSAMAMVVIIGTISSLPLREILLIHYFLNACICFNTWICSGKITQSYTAMKYKIYSLLFVFFPKHNVIINILCLIIIILFTGFSLSRFHFVIGKPIFWVRTILGRTIVILYFYYNRCKYLV